MARPTNKLTAVAVEKLKKIGRQPTATASISTSRVRLEVVGLDLGEG